MRWNLPMGTPVVATRVGGNPEVIEDRVSGLLVPPGDLQALTQVICAVLQDKKRANRLGRAAKGRVMELFSRETQDLYIQLLEENTKGACRRCV
jgi:starch synthase